MAGIGLQLRTLLRNSRLASVLPSYSYAMLLSSAPTLISIIGVFLLGFIFYVKFQNYLVVVQFIAVIVYLMALSLIVGGVYQHSFIRYVGDCLYEELIEPILPNYHGILLIQLITAGVLGFVLTIIAFPGQNTLFILLVMSSFVLLNAVWLSHHLLIGLQAHYTAFAGYLLGYGLALGLGFFMRNLGIEGLLVAFFAGNVVLFIILQITIYHYFPSNQLIRFDYFKAAVKGYAPYIGVSFCLYLGIWIDKFMFWYTGYVSHPVIGLLRGSYVYDVPVLLAYLSAVPGVIIMLIRVESEFDESYQHYSKAIVKGESLSTIDHYRKAMIAHARGILRSVLKGQFVVVLVVVVLAEGLLQVLGLPEIHARLVRILTISVGLAQVLMLGLLDLIIYLDEAKYAFLITLSFCLFNGVFTLLSLYLGPEFYGIGFGVAVLLVDLLALHCLNKAFANLNYEIYMLREAG